MKIKKLRTFVLDQDERDYIDCLVENSIIKQRIIKYAVYHGHNVENTPFEYNKDNGEVSYYGYDGE